MRRRDRRILETGARGFRPTRVFKDAVAIFKERPSDGYTTVRAILESGPGLLAESYAGVALARIAGVEARSDLLRILREGKSRHAREGTIYGLELLGDSSVVDDIFNALRDGFICPRAASRVVARFDPATPQLADWLRAEDERTRLFALDIIIERKQPTTDDAVIAAARGGLAGTDVSQWLRQKVEAKLGC